jgi:HK97 gp10 family phage protein
MSTIRFEVDNKELIRALERLGGQEASAILAKGVLEGTEIIRDEIKRTAPDSGLPVKRFRGEDYTLKLRKDVIVKEVVVKPTSLLGRVVALPFYAIFVERGTSKMRPNPFMRKATDRKRPQAVQAFRDAVERMVKTVVR